MARKAEVMLGTFMADIELTPGGSVILRITGADISERLFEHFVASKPRMDLIEFDPNVPKKTEGRCFP